MGFILQLAQSFHMIDAVFKFFNMAIQHGGIAVHSHFMRGSVYVQPAICIHFICAYLLAVYPDEKFLRRRPAKNQARLHARTSYLLLQILLPCGTCNPVQQLYILLYAVRAGALLSVSSNQ